MNQKRVVFIAFVILVVAGGGAWYFVFSNWSTVPQPTPNAFSAPARWRFIEAGKFTLFLPPGWGFNTLKGKDSYVGEIVGDNARLSFDFGWYSNPLAGDGDLQHVVTYETIDGRRAKVVVPRVAGNGTTGVYFGDLGNQNRFNLYGNNLTSLQQETALKIFRTLKFTK